MKLFFHKYNRKTWLVFAVALAAAFVLLPLVPEQIPVHFGLSGGPDRYGSPLYLFLAPAIILLFQLAAELFRRIDPKKDSYQAFEAYYYDIMFLVSLLMLALEFCMAATALGFALDVGTVITVLVGLLLACIGNMLPKFKHNYFAGIRTSWTLADEQVWYLTHRMAAKFWMAGGVLIAACAFLPNVWKFALLMVVVLVISVVPTVASYHYYKKLHPGKAGQR